MWAGAPSTGGASRSSSRSALSVSGGRSSGVAERLSMDTSYPVAPEAAKVCRWFDMRDAQTARAVAAHLEVDGPQRAAIVIDGDFDIAGEPHARSLLREAVEAHVEALEIDFCAASFADCSAVRLALQAREEVGAYGGRLSVRAPRAVQRVFDLTQTTALVGLVR